MSFASAPVLRARDELLQRRPNRQCGCSADTRICVSAVVEHPLQAEQGFDLAELAAEAQDLLLAMRFIGPRLEGAVIDAGVALTSLGNVSATFGEYQTSKPRIFACGDMRRGQSLVVWAIHEGRDCAAKVDAFMAAEAKVTVQRSLSSKPASIMPHF